MGKRFENRVALLFGGTSKISSVTGLRMVEEGAKIVIQHYGQAEKAANCQKKLEAAGGEVLVIEANCVDPAEVKRVYAETVARFGSVDIVVNFIHTQAAYPTTFVRDMDWDENWLPHIDTLRCNFNICQQAIPYMEKQHYGRIIYISGGLAYRFYKGASAFTALKAGMNGFCKCMAKEEGKHNITVNIVSPGKVVTPDMVIGDNPNGERFAEDNIEKCALGRYSVPEDIAGAIIFFASPDADGVTGQTMYVCGGEIMPMP